MGKYKIYKNRLEMFLSSDRGKRLLNFCYSWGASVVILGAMFKILHLQYGNQMLAIGMVTEFIVFFIFGFEKPNADYRWEDVFPVLKSRNPLDRPEFDSSPGSIIVGDNSNKVNGTQIASGGGGTIAGSGGTIVGGGGTIVGGGSSINIGSQEDSDNLSSSIQKVLDAADRIAQIPELADATQKYLEQMAKISSDLEHFSTVTDSLSNVSNGINRNSQNYVQQMEILNRNVAGLNTIYELQLKSISSQISSIEHINSGLNRIKDLYEGSIVDSSVFRSETEKMAQQLSQLNMVYARLLQAMTVNMGMPLGGVQPNPFQSNPYQTK